MKVLSLLSKVDMIPYRSYPKHLANEFGHALH